MAPQVKNPNEPNPNGFTVLQTAAQFGSTEIFKFLAPQVENPNEPGPNGVTPKEIAAKYGSTEIYKFLALEDPQYSSEILIKPTGGIGIKIKIKKAPETGE